jgi:hypothetical protein
LVTATQSLCAQEKKCRYLTKEISRILQIIDSHRNDPQQIANSEHITKIMEINYFDARSASVDAEDDNANMKLPIALGGMNDFHLQDSCGC